jgi:hypothetical protein
MESKEEKKHEKKTSQLSNGLDKIQEQTDALKKSYQESFDKLQEEWDKLEKEKELFKEMSKKIETVHFSQVITLNIGNHCDLQWDFDLTSFRWNTFQHKLIYITI